jgi:hypothetical protein
MEEMSEVANVEEQKSDDRPSGGGGDQIEGVESRKATL